MGDETWPPKCIKCGKFVAPKNAEFVRRYYAPPAAGCDDVNTSRCDDCKMKEPAND